jgi:hypothetical protein
MALAGAAESSAYSIRESAKPPSDTRTSTRPQINLTAGGLFSFLLFRRIAFRTATTPRGIIAGTHRSKRRHGLQRQDNRGRVGRSLDKLSSFYLYIGHPSLSFLGVMGFLDHLK